MLTCCIRYEIDPFKRAKYEQLCPRLGRGDPALRRRSDRLFRPARGFGHYRLRLVQHRESGGVRGVSRAPGGRSARARELRVRAARALHPARGPHLPEAGLGPARQAGAAMIAVIFEVEPARARGIFPHRRRTARRCCDEIDGFISIERFQSLSDEGRVLSLSFWRDEAAVAAVAQHGGASRGAGGGTRARVPRLSPARGAGGARLWHARARGSAAETHMGARTARRAVPTILDLGCVRRLRVDEAPQVPGGGAAERRPAFAVRAEFLRREVAAIEFLRALAHAEIVDRAARRGGRA